MARFAAGLFVLLAGASQAVLRDVPLGECYDCEVTCFEDCALKYDREVLQMDFIQLPGKKNHTTQLTEQYGKCLQEDKCPCNKNDAPASSSPALKLMAVDKKKKGKCAVGAMSCSTKCGHKVVEQDIAAMTKTGASKKALLQKKEFPLHPVSINVFAKGAMTLDTCLKYCLAATCGCDAGMLDAPGAMAKALKANSAVKGVLDTPKSPKYKPAKIEECAKGMIGKKVASGLFIKIDGGPLGMYEICSMPFLKKILGPSGDFDGITAKCKSAASDDVKYGCSWDNVKGKCVVGFSPILTCQVEYFTDPTL